MIRPQSTAILLEYLPIGPPPPDIYIALDHVNLRRLGVKTGEESHFYRTGQDVLNLMNQIADLREPTVGENPRLRAHLEANRNTLMALRQDGLPYLYRFVSNC